MGLFPFVSQSLLIPNVNFSIVASLADCIHSLIVFIIVRSEVGYEQLLLLFLSTFKILS